MLTEQEMRDTKVPTFTKSKELADYIDGLTNRPHDYGTYVYAVSMAAVAAYNHVANKLGVTGFQAGCADMDILRRTRHMDRFMIINLENALYPQYHLQERLERALEEVKPWLAEKAQEQLDKLEGVDKNHIHPEVLAHWQDLANSS